MRERRAYPKRNFRKASRAADIPVERSSFRRHSQFEKQRKPYRRLGAPGSLGSSRPFRAIRLLPNNVLTKVHDLYGFVLNFRVTAFVVG